MFFLIHRQFIETATTDVDMLLQVTLQFCNNGCFIAISDVIMLFCPLLDDLILCRIGVAGKKCGLTVAYLIW